MARVVTAPHAGGRCACSCHRAPLRVAATAVPSYVPPSPSSLDRPAGGGSRSFDPPRTSDLVPGNWGPTSDLMRPSGGANRGSPAFYYGPAAASASPTDRPGGRSGRGDLPAGWDVPASGDPAGARPGGRGGRDAGLSSTDGAPVTPISLDRPGGRGGRESVGGGDGGDGGSGSGGSGGSGGDGGDDGASGAGGGGFGKGVGGVALYAGALAAAWAGHKAFFSEPAKPEPAKSCCSGKGKKGGK